MDFHVKNKTLMLLGMRGSGKSNMLKYIVGLSKHEFQAIFLISPTEQINKFYSGLIKPENIFANYDELWTERLMKKMVEMNTDKPASESSHVLLILDDCIADVNFNKSKCLKALFVRGRHLKISIIITSQYINSLPPIIRSNCDFIAVSQINTQGLDLLVNEYRFGCIDKAAFKKLYYKNTSNYGFLLINCNCCSNNENIDEIYGSLVVPREMVK